MESGNTGFRVESCFIVHGAMPLIAKKKEAETARTELRKGKGSKRIQTEPQESDLSRLLSMSDDALDTEDENANHCFDLDASMKSDVEHLAENFCEDWVSHLERDDRVSLKLFLCFQFTKHLDTADTKAAEIAGMIIGRSDKTVREYRKQFLEDGEILESKQGKYQRSGVMWSSEELNKKAARYIRENANVKGQPTLTVEVLYVLTTTQYHKWHVLIWYLGNMDTLEQVLPSKVYQAKQTSNRRKVSITAGLVS